MAQQLMIALSREFGSGGHEIAERLAKVYRLPLYDRSLLSHIANEKQVDVKRLEQYDELPKNQFLSRRIKGLSNSPEENIANMQFDFLRKKAQSGESFVVVGRCAESVLKGYPGLVSIFVLGDMECKIGRIMEREKLKRQEAESQMERTDRRRKGYHNYYCPVKWGDSRNYDLCINSSRLGVEQTAKILEVYINQRKSTEF